MLKQYKRPLTSAQSAACACAMHKRCTCRCGGLLHGVNHSQYQQLEQSYLQEQGYITETQVQDIIQFLKED